MQTADANTEKRRLVEEYVRAYNASDIDAMLAGLDERITFTNVSDGEVTLELHGIDAFRQQAEKAAGLFSEREQTITKLTFTDDDLCETEIDYRARLAVDLPNGLKAGDAIELTGRSLFRFRDGKISEIRDIS